MSKFYDSYEAERLRKLIVNKEAYLQTLQGDKSKAAYQLTQREIMFLRSDILPLVLMNSNIVHSEVAKYVVKCFDAAVTHKANGIVMYISIDENYTDRPKIAIFNERANLQLGTPGAMEMYIDNMDCNGCKIEPMNINFNALI